MKDVTESKAKECTFKPQINAKSAKLVQKLDLKMKLVETVPTSNKLEDQENQAPLSHNELKPKVLSKRELEEFLLRQSEFERLKKTKLTLISDTQTHPFEPAICSNSINILKDRKERPGRNLDHISRKLEFASSLDCPFRPEITQLAKQRQPSTDVDLCYGDTLKR